MRRPFLVVMLLWVGLQGLAMAQDEDLDRLTPKQSRAMRSLRDRYEGRLQDLRMKLEGRKLALAQLLSQDDVDKASAKALMDEILDLERQRQQVFLDELFEAREHLRPRQWGAYRRRVLRGLLGEGRQSGGGRLPRRESDPTSP